MGRARVGIHVERRVADVEAHDLQELERVAGRGDPGLQTVVEAEPQPLRVVFDRLGEVHRVAGARQLAARGQLQIMSGDEADHRQREQVLQDPAHRDLPLGGIGPAEHLVEKVEQDGRLAFRHELVREAAYAELLPGERRRLHAACALEAVGVGTRALELGVEHAGSRQQFGRPVGVFQAVSHALATTFVELETARSVAYWAAWCVAESDPQAPVAAAAAKAKATEAAVAACERSIQVHGGIGFTWEHVLHRLYKRAQWLERFGGGPAELRALVAAAILDDVSEEKERDGLQSIVA